MLATLKRELTHEIDRITLYSDPLRGIELAAALKRWLTYCSQAESAFDDRLFEAEGAALAANCLDHDIELGELRETVATLEERIRQAKEIL